MQAGVLGHLRNALAVEAEHLVAAGEELALVTEFLGLGVRVVHELVDQGNGDLLDLGFGVGHFADEDVAGGVDAAFGVGV